MKACRDGENDDVCDELVCPIQYFSWTTKDIYKGKRINDFAESLWYCQKECNLRDDCLSIATETTFQYGSSSTSTSRLSSFFNRPSPVRQTKTCHLLLFDANENGKTGPLGKTGERVSPIVSKRIYRKRIQSCYPSHDSPHVFGSGIYKHAQNTTDHLNALYEKLELKRDEIAAVFLDETDTLASKVDDYLKTKWREAVDNGIPDGVQTIWPVTTKAPVTPFKFPSGFPNFGSSFRPFRPPTPRPPTRFPVTRSVRFNIGIRSPWHSSYSNPWSTKSQAMMRRTIPSFSRVFESHGRINFSSIRFRIGAIQQMRLRKRRPWSIFGRKRRNADSEDSEEVPEYEYYYEDEETNEVEIDFEVETEDDQELKKYAVTNLADDLETDMEENKPEHYDPDWPSGFGVEKIKDVPEDDEVGYLAACNDDDGKVEMRVCIFKNAYSQEFCLIGLKLMKMMRCVDRIWVVNL